VPTYSVNLYALDGRHAFAVAREVARGVLNRSPEPVETVRVVGDPGRLARVDEAAFERLRSEPGVRVEHRGFLRRLLAGLRWRWRGRPSPGAVVGGRSDVLRGSAPATPGTVDATLRLVGPGLHSATFRDATGVNRLRVHHIDAVQFRLPEDRYRDLCDALGEDARPLVRRAASSR
jgi:hypothetical protein